jgi:hypothetical protein
MKRKLALMVLIAAAGHASTLLLDATGLPPADENGNYGSSNATYNGFVTATVNGVANQLILCDDFLHTTDVPSGNMVYDFSTVGGSDPLQNVRFTQGNEVQNYEEAAVLTWQLFEYVSVNGSGASNNTITDYQYALWNIFDPYNASGNPDGVKVNSNQSALQTTALGLMSTESAVLAADVYPYVKVYTPDPNGGSSSNQEFLQYAAPEPGTLLLLAGALLVGTAVTARRELRKRQAARS